jgi:hypothetical protein
MDKFYTENVNTAGRWNVGEPGGPSGPYFSVVTAAGGIVALQVPDAEIAREIAKLPQYAALTELAARLVNPLDFPGRRYNPEGLMGLIRLALKDLEDPDWLRSAVDKELGS